MPWKFHHDIEKAITLGPPPWISLSIFSLGIPELAPQAGYDPRWSYPVCGAGFNSSRDTISCFFFPLYYLLGDTTPAFNEGGLFNKQDINIWRIQNSPLSHVLGLLLLNSFPPYTSVSFLSCCCYISMKTTSNSSYFPQQLARVTRILLDLRLRLLHSHVYPSRAC